MARRAPAGSRDIEPLPWQTCTCIGNWHDDRSVYNNKSYKSAQTVVQTLIDVVSKNGNLLGNPDDAKLKEIKRPLLLAAYLPSINPGTV